MGKKILVFGSLIITLFFLISGVSAVSITQKNSSQNVFKSNIESDHTIFCELAVTSDGENCPETAEILKNLKESGEYNFEYVTYVADQFPDALNWLEDEYNIAGYPTCFFDGGYDVLYKAPPVENTFVNKLNIVSNRNTHDLYATVYARWFEDCCNQRLEMNVSVKNNEGTPYHGFLRVYLVEKNSRWGYQIDGENKSYQYAFLDFIMNEQIYVPASKNITFEASSWVPDGSIIVDSRKLTIIAVISDFSSYPGYSDPPYNEHSFYSHTVDEVAVKKIKENSVKNKIKEINGPFKKGFHDLLNLLHRLFFKLDIFFDAISRTPNGT